MQMPGRKFWFWLAALGGAIAACVLYVFPPDQYPWYPRCAFYLITGLKCPGCGGLRAAHYLLHGDFAAAFHSNPLLVVIGPCLAIGSVCYGISRRWRKPIPAILEHPAWLWALLGVVVAFGVVRNLH